MPNITGILGFIPRFIYTLGWLYTQTWNWCGLPVWFDAYCSHSIPRIFWTAAPLQRPAKRRRRRKDSWTSSAVQRHQPWCLGAPATSARHGSFQDEISAECSECPSAPKTFWEGVNRAQKTIPNTVSEGAWSCRDAIWWNLEYLWIFVNIWGI